MGRIGDITGVPPEINKPGVKKVEDERTNRKSERIDKDILEISSVGKELLNKKTEAAQSVFMDEVRQAETLDETRMALIQERMENNFYNDPNVIDKILDELMELPYFDDGKRNFSDKG